MKIIKRDGRVVEYNRDKIALAINKANNDVVEHERIGKKQIDTIIKHIEELNKKRMLVEDIQDLIETELMRLKKYELAKAYIIYRYNRALVRKSNTTDESIMNLIKNSNNDILDKYNDKSHILVSQQRNLIAGEVSKDLTKRVLLPEKISNAHQEGVLFFHDAEYFLQPIFNSSLINYKDMLQNGTVINNMFIEIPTSFLKACIALVQIIVSVSQGQYGEQSINIEHLGHYLKISEDNYKKQIIDKYKNNIAENDIERLVKDLLKEELVMGIETIQYQLNTINSPITLFLYLNKNDLYIEYTALIIEEILNQKYKGFKNENGTYITSDIFKLVYVLDENNNLLGGKYDYLTELAIKCSSERLYPMFLSAKKMKENYEGNVFSPIGLGDFLSCYKNEGSYKFEGRFNQGIVSINLPQIALLSERDETLFWSLLDEKLELCCEALMCRHYALLGTLSDVCPIIWQYGAITRLNKGEKIDKYLKNGYSTLSLNYVGIYETTKLMTNATQIEPDGERFALKLVKHIKSKCNEWKKQTGLGITLSSYFNKDLCKYFAQIDKDKFGDIKDITDKGYYTNSYYINTKENIDQYTKIKIESQFQTLSNGLIYVNLPNNLEELKKMIRYIYDNVQYIAFNKNSDIKEEK